MCTRAKASVVKPRLHPTILLAHSETKSTKTALSNPTWLAAMKAEYEALMKNGMGLLLIYLHLGLLLAENGCLG